MLRLPAALLFSFAATLLLIPSVCAPADIVLEKDLSGAKSAPPAPGETYTVRPGDSLSAILARAGVPASRIEEYLQILGELNPGLVDPDRIHPGQEIRIPSPDGADPVPPGDSPVHAVTSPSLPVDPSLPHIAALRESGELIPLLRDTLSAIEEELRDSGTITRPLSAAGIVTLDNRQYPLLDLTTGRSLLIDIDGQMPQEWKDRIEARWPGYRVVEPRSEGDLRSLLSDLFSESGFHSVVRDSPLSIGKEGTIRVTPDFLLAKESRSLLEGTLYLVDVELPGSEGLPHFIRKKARDHRIEVVEVGSGKTGDRGGKSPYPRRRKKITASDMRTLIGEVSSSIGLRVTPNHVHRPRGRNSGEGLQVEVTADLLIERDGRFCLLFLDPLDSWVTELLDGEGVPYVAAGINDPLHVVLGQILTRLGIPYSGPFVEFFRPRGRYAFALSGFYLDSARGPLFLTTEEPDNDVASFLSSRGINIVTCLLAP